MLCEYFDGFPYFFIFPTTSYVHVLSLKSFDRLKGSGIPTGTMKLTKKVVFDRVVNYTMFMILNVRLFFIL